MNDLSRDDGLPPPPGGKVLPRAEHSLSRSRISPNALKVLYRLHRAGFLAYLVGGAVRDLLLGRQPKDFDIGTNARPQQVRQLFRNARIIGRRFRLVMVTFADEVVEVATFRRSPEVPDMEDGEIADALAPTVEGEEFGTPEEDAWRRDFTINALFYSISDFSLIDHVGGLADLDRGVIRSIGPARLRFGNDPVRMMRAVEYAARLGFAIDPEAADAIGELRAEIRRAAPARIAYELGESLKGGAAEPIFRGLDEAGLLELIAPEMSAAARVNGDVSLWRLLGAGDAAVRAGKRPSEDALVALLLLPLFVPCLQRVLDTGTAGGDSEREARELWAGVALRLSFSHYRTHLLRNAYYLLARMLAVPRSAKQVVRVVRHEAHEVATWMASFLAATSERFRPALERWQGAADRVAAGLPPLTDGGEGTASPARRRRRRRRRGKRQLREGATT
ncbi:MAG: hypothetical protein KA072_05070 [Thermoanaerobaculaceae bacterium]|nr:hypothetical protein [Thermoanaerobaculaceae bacterium]MDI9621157.1 hypothetical protein [Acidobacteriota bacterium]NLH11267.1 hypothetical protein [Holophagae bacterium]